MFKTAIDKVIRGQDLTEEAAAILMDDIMSGRMTDAQIGSFITALRIKGETVAEITGFARVMRQKATTVSTIHSLILDTCGTGGDGSHSFNISTTVALVVAAAGIPVAKHGNRSVSSRSGSADVLEKLGVNLNLSPEQVGQCIDKVGIGFLFAPSLHSAMKYAVGPRREIGIRTVFNILGPLTNPAGAQVQLLGVYEPELTDIVAGVLAKLGSKSAFVVHGAGGLDEISTLGPTRISEVKDGQVTTYYVDPQEFGIPYAQTEDLKGGTAEENAIITRAILSGEMGPKRDIVVLNTAISLMAAGAVNSVPDGIMKACETIDKGLAAQKLDELIKFTGDVAELQAKVG